MDLREKWLGVLLGLIVGAVFGYWLLEVRSDLSLFRDGPGGSGHPGDPGEGSSINGTVNRNSGQDSVLNSGAEENSGEAQLSARGETLLQGRTNAIVRATREVAPAVVSINVVQQKAVRSSPSMEFMERMGLIPRRGLYSHVQSMGSGLIVSADGLVVTNQHVVADAVQVVVTLSNGQQYQAQLLESVSRYDLAFLRIEGRNLPFATLSDADDLQIGEWAIAIGSPFGYLLADTQPTVTVGVISALNRDIKRAEGDREYLGMIQTDAAINPGNSGGPLINTAGEVVGINTFIFSESGGSVGIGFAVPSARVLTVIREIQEFGHYREFSLGFTLQRLSPGMVQYLGLDDPLGFLVVYILQDAPAWKSGLRPGDIIRQMEGQPLTSRDVLYRLIYEASVGDKLGFQAERDGQDWSGEILIEETP
ncbi:MAG: trypsin-like peptidase domain-containing protein [Gemmatimonadales bacterium]|nr:trypsin-like peptidase domain-containing protein [Gemmatimonadales bacterium]